MKLFRLFQKKPQLTEEQRRWNLMWDMWLKGTAASPYAQLMTYQSEVNNGGHSQYFFNTANCGDLGAEVEQLLTVLPAPHLDNLKRGYDAFAAQTDISDDRNDLLFSECDDVFYDNEQLINDILKAYADSLKLQ